MDKIPQPNTTAPRKQDVSRKRRLLVRVLLALGLATVLGFQFNNVHRLSRLQTVPLHADKILDKCRQLNAPAGPPSNFHERTVSDRFESGTPPTLIKNATIWTGRVSGYEVVKGDILLDKGIILAIGDIEQAYLNNFSELNTVDAGGAWVTPGIVDIHSHIGVGSAPDLKGADDTNSLKGLALPWLRSLDGLNTHDDSYQLSISGGLTTANILPGSADAIGGQAFTIKLRSTSERSTSAMLLEPPYTINASYVDPSLPPRWRQMKHACGENPSRVYSGTRMDTIWAFRQAYDTARKIKEEQDTYCEKASAGKWDNLGPFPEDLQWEALVDVLRGRVKVHNHCYEAVDLDGMVRITNEFKFSIAAFHHAHETYLVPDLLKKAYGHPPGVALFATNARYKREAYRGSEFAPRILADSGLQVVMKSDHYVLNSRHLINEAQQAHYYGLASNLALASVTSTPAAIMGLDHRIGLVKTGYDADLVIWDSHPLALGAAPQQVFIDGIAQLETPHVTPKNVQAQKAPKTPNFDKEAQLAVEYDGLPPLTPQPEQAASILFTNVSRVHTRGPKCGISQVYSMSEAGELGAVFVNKGKIICVGLPSICGKQARTFKGDIKVIDLQGGSIAPALTSFGSPLGLEDIQGESSTKDGKVIDPLKSDVPSILGGDGSVIRAVDGLQFSSRDALIAYHAGVTAGISSPISSGFLSGLGTAFTTGAFHKLSKGAVLQDETALHITIGAFTTPSVSTQISLLRRLLNSGGEGDLGEAFKKIIKGEIPIVVAVDSADIMATLITLKREVESETKTPLQVTFIGAAEAHLLAKEIGEAGIGVVLRPVRPFPATWKSRRILPGPPLTAENAASTLIRHNVTVGIGIEESWSARNIRFDAGWVGLEAGEDSISYEQALALASTNLEKLLGLKKGNSDLVAIAHGDFLSFEGKPTAIISEGRNTVDLL
ncbi:composite domain of metallo-dependent hydrolase [Macrolepiota fuliginosa MF-IS2]|uniref:Composite domain of metallo-dependent hydrolase n=1 Tax=Macrolepiota fuliginosa MF-IS2 TaxID=1400762 RepID=A0A9P5XG89_9AGAR|nr:composite domain of metallo-dependent hydrolase [Macrolepiota fuliginosa MF-IS2]